MLQYFKYKLPFSKTFKTANHEFSEREGIILAYKEGNITAYGEAAPLPGFSKETLEEVRTVLTMNHRELEKEIRGGEGENLLRLLSQIHSFPSLNFALDTLLHDLWAKKEEKTLHQYLHNGNENDEEEEKVACNATIPVGEKRLAIEAARQAWSEGFSTIKVKMGNNFDKESALLKELRDAFPKLKIRIDANAAWQVDEAIENLNSIADLNIEYCEQPVAANDYSGMAKVRESVEIPIAADESVRSKNDAIRIVGEKAADILVIKPMLFGLLRDINVTKQLADSHDIELVFTTSLESMVGRSTTAILAHDLGSKKYAHGLATGHLLEKDIAGTDFIKDGYFCISKKPGVGVPIDLKLLEKM